MKTIKEFCDLSQFKERTVELFRSTDLNNTAIYFTDFFTVLIIYIKQEVLKYIKILPSFNSHLTLKMIFESTNKLNCLGLYNNR